MSKINEFLTRERVYVFWAIGLSVVGCFLLITALFMNPVGIIDPSVISAAGTIFVFAGSIIGIRGSFDAKIQKFEMDVDRKMKNKENKEEEIG